MKRIQVFLPIVGLKFVKLGFFTVAGNCNQDIATVPGPILQQARNSRSGLSLGQAVGFLDCF